MADRKEVLSPPNLPQRPNNSSPSNVTSGHQFTVVTLSPLRREEFCGGRIVFPGDKEHMIGVFNYGSNLNELGDSRKAVSVPAKVKVVEWMKNVPIILAYEDNICFLECYPGCTDDDTSSNSLLTDFTDDVVEFQARKITQYVRQMYMAEPEPVASLLCVREEVPYSQESYGDCENLSVFYGITSQAEC